MSKLRPLELYTVRAVAEAEGISYSHMRKLLMDIAKQQPAEWRGWRFVPFGPEKRKVWLAYKDNRPVVIHNGPGED